MAVTAKADPDASKWEGAALGAALGAAGAFLARDVGIVFPASAWMLGAAVGAVLWGTWVRRWIVVVILLLALLWTAAAWTRFTPFMVRGLVRKDVEQHVDAILVLGSRIQMDGEPTAPALTRLLHGMELMADGWAPRLILPELPPPSPAFAPVARKLMQNLRLEGEIVSVGPVTRTRDEAVVVGALCRERGFCRILVVTSPTHTRRACAALEREGLQVFSSPALETRFDLETLDRPEERLPAFATSLHERLGIWYYRRRGWIRP